MVKPDLHAACLSVALNTRKVPESLQLYKNTNAYFVQTHTYKMGCPSNLCT